MSPRLLFAGAALALLCTLASAERKTVYRCGQAYQDSPCAGGATVDVSDERSAAERQAARDAARAEAKLGSRLERERLARERSQPTGGAANLGARADATVAHEPTRRLLKPTKKKAVTATLKPMRKPKPAKAAGKD